MSKTREPFIMLPSAILSRRDIGSAAKLVYAVIVDHMRKKGTSWPGTRKIAARIGVSKNTVVDAVGQLERVGLLTVQRRRRGQSNLYSLPFDSPESGSKIGPLPSRERIEQRPTSESQSVSKVGPRVSKIDTLAYRKSIHKKRRHKKQTVAPDGANPQSEKKNKKTLRRDAIWDAVTALWWPSGVPTGSQAHVGRIVRDFGEIGATPDEIRRRKARAHEVWGTDPRGKPITVTAESVVKRWDQLGPDAEGGDDFEESLAKAIR